MKIRFQGKRLDLTFTGTTATTVGKEGMRLSMEAANGEYVTVELTAEEMRRVVAEAAEQDRRAFTAAMKS